MKRIAIFASGSGSNAENIIRHFRDTSCAEVVLVLSNKSDARVIDRAKNHAIHTEVFSREALHSTTKILDLLKEYNASILVLAGFLLKIPRSLVLAYPNSIVNIHPALLPKFGGKGMYGIHVHEAVVAAQETETGITIHYVNDQYDEGAIIFQARCRVEPSDDAVAVQRKVQALEAKHFPTVLEQLLL